MIYMLKTVKYLGKDTALPEARLVLVEDHGDSIEFLLSQGSQSWDQAQFSVEGSLHLIYLGKWPGIVRKGGGGGFSSLFLDFFMDFLRLFFTSETVLKTFPGVN